MVEHGKQNHGCQQDGRLRSEDDNTGAGKRQHGVELAGDVVLCGHYDCVGVYVGVNDGGIVGERCSV